MAVKTGANGQMRYNGQIVAKVREFTLQTQKDSLETTAIGSYDRTYTPGIRGTTGTCTVYYDPSNATAVKIFDSIYEDRTDLDTVNFISDQTTNKGFACEVFVTSVGQSIAVGAAQAVNISFQISGKPTGSF